MRETLIFFSFHQRHVLFITIIADYIIPSSSFLWFYFGIFSRRLIGIVVSTVVTAGIGYRRTSNVVVCVRPIKKKKHNIRGEYKNKYFYAGLSRRSDFNCLLFSSKTHLQSVSRSVCWTVVGSRQ